MGNRSSRQQDQSQAQGPSGGGPPGVPPPPPPAPTPGPVYAQYPSPQNYRPHIPTNGLAPMPPPHPPSYYPPPTNGAYYGGWSANHRPPPPPPYQQQQHSFNQPYPHAPPPPLPPGPPPATPTAPPPPNSTTTTNTTQQLTQTATIRNSVNLKKSSLAVSSSPQDPSKLLISFTFDCSAPCVVSTFVLATEDGAKGNKLTTAKQPPAPHVKYPKGLGHTFPGGSSLVQQQEQQQQQQHYIDLELHGDDIGALTSPSETTFPLVIRLEVITEKGLKEGRTLDGLVPGAEQQPWAQSQTTFAALHKEEDGSWSVRVLKQKIWVEGTSYELQEIYGLEHAGGRKAASAAEEAEERLCVICLVNPRDTTVLPCRHMCLCSDCAGELRKQTSKCPICRNQIESLLHIRINKQQQAAAAAGAAGAGGSNSSTGASGGGGGGDKERRASNTGNESGSGSAIPTSTPTPPPSLDAVVAAERGTATVV